MLATLATGTALVTLPALYRREANRERRRRGELFTDCMPLFDSCRVTQIGKHFPILEGRYRGMSVRLEPVLDDIGVRKLPSLWLKATLLVFNPARGVLDFIVRPQGIEFYSPSHDLRQRLPIPADWPQHALLATDDDTAMPALERLAPHIGLFRDPRMKEMVITPRGVRLVYQAGQGVRADYLVLRQARFATARLDQAVVKLLLDGVTAIAADLDSDVLEARAA